ncbi:Pseudouridine synthase I, TruA like protein, partial [Aduncisulcus paluster]
MGKKPVPEECPRRHIAIKLAYIGWEYSGVAIQPHSDTTVEHHLMKALEESGLIPKNSSLADIGFSRGGRTDKGVSAFGQVMAFYIRSRVESGPGILSPTQSIPKTQEKVGYYRTYGRPPLLSSPFPPDEFIGHVEGELPYTMMINSRLPEDIRVLGWCPVPHRFDARHSARARVYREEEEEEEEEREEKEEKEVPKYGKRRCFSSSPSATAVSLSTPSVVAHHSPYELYEMRIRGTAFLYHQVRCMTAILFEIGMGYESESLVEDLLDVPTLKDMGIEGTVKESVRDGAQAQEDDEMCLEEA